MQKFVIFSRDYRDYVKHWRAIQNDFEHVECIYAGDNLEQAAFYIENAHILLSEPDLASQVIEGAHHLTWLQSTWAGNEKLQLCAKRGYALTGVKGIFSAKMREYVFAYILYFQRYIAEFEVKQRKKVWWQPRLETLAGKTLGIMGYGCIAKALDETARAFEMNVRAIVRDVAAHTDTRNKDIALFTLKEKERFAAQCDYCVNLLPSTEETKGIIDTDFLSALPKHAVLINAGRGDAIQSEEALSKALNDKHLRAAVLDVCQQEPLEENSSLYTASNAWITNHSAAISDPSSVFDVFTANLHLHITGKALMYQHDFSKGY
ncbi:NAD(P)-dependent oxidoreductase [Ningiella sp. W23]|uniref:NAD(P)-dependent oxidoreductase n=1 Tax=Ningiella sp. W23 TaxID=3023715 RepID=UPI003757C52A